MNQLISNQLQELLDQSPSSLKAYRLNVLREYLQAQVLSFIYTHKVYHQLIFYGGTALRFCYQLPRLSEDIDFIDLNRSLSLEEIGRDIAAYLTKTLGLPVSYKVQKFRIYLKFPILSTLNLSSGSESDLLLIKIEVFKQFTVCQNFQIITLPIFKFNQSLIVRSLDLSTLMATKIGAVINRHWRKVSKEGEILATVKGRDYFDLIWYLSQNLKPNLTCIPEAQDLSQLKSIILKAVDQANPASIRYDLEPFIADLNYVTDLSQNYKQIITGQLDSWS